MPNLIALAVPLFFIAMAIELLVARKRKQSIYRAGAAMSDIGCGVAQQLVGLLVTALTLAIYSQVYAFRLITLPEKSVISWVLAIVGVEVGYYWWHRLSHRVNILWAAHVVHHHSEDYNLAVALRQSVTTWATMLPFYLPMALLGVPVFEYAVVLALSTLYQFWIHTQLVPKLGVIELIFNTPSQHRVHHGTNQRYLDKNYAATFGFIDRAFGSYQEEDENEPVVYGITHPLGSYNVLWAQVAGYVDVFRAARQAPSLGQAVKVVLAPPGWTPPWLTKPPLATTGVKYEPSTAPSPRAAWYVLGQFALLIVGVFSFMMWGAALSDAVRAACFVLFTLTLFSVSALSESKTWGWASETVRWVAIVSVTVLLLTGVLR